MGGDGTLMRVIDNIVGCDQSINIKELVFVLLPFGSGNDMAQTLKWGKNAEQNYLRNLDSIVNEINSSAEVNVNIWDVKMKVLNDGDIQTNVDKIPKTVFNNTSPENEKTFTVRMLNYYSMGHCAEIGYNFE